MATTLEQIARLIPTYPNEITRPYLAKMVGIEAGKLSDRMVALTYRYPIAEREGNGTIYYCMVR